MKEFTKKLLSFFILTIARPLTWFSAKWSKFVMIHFSKEVDKTFMRVGVLPIFEHYYSPLVNPKKHLISNINKDRTLNGLDMNVNEQLEILNKFYYSNELLKFPINKVNDLEFYYNNKSYDSGDSEYLYSMIRHFKPKHIIEIGCGSSTLMIRNAVHQNKLDDNNYSCIHYCIEPYEQPWLENIDVEVIRKRVEDIELSFFKKLQANDLLFIDSSHMIKPQGDVLFEYFDILPNLNSGVIIHIHDIFTPKDYPQEWIYRHVLWNEQYLLEAFLMFNNEYKVIGSLNFLANHYKNEFYQKCPIFNKQSKENPSMLELIRAFWIMKK